MLGYLDSLATIEDDRLQKRLLKELIHSYVVLEKRVDALLKNTLPETVAEEIKCENRSLRFISTPYAHSQGSFVTYDEKTRTLFTSDLFGSFSTQWDLFIQLEEACFICNDYKKCPNGKTYCPFPDMIQFHQDVMPCEKALRHAIRKIKGLDVDMIAPQHGSVLNRKRDIHFLADTLESLNGVGIDAIV